MTRALVTGAGGFVGQHLVARLRADGHEVTALTRADADLAVPGQLAEAVRRAAPEVALHLAAARSPVPRAAAAAVNATSAVELVDALPDDCRVVLRLGSSTEYAASSAPIDERTPLAPRGFFGAAKAAGSLLLTAAAAERGLRSVVLRAFQVYGPGDKPGRFVPAVLRAAATGEVLPLTGPGLRRDWVWVGDVVDACVRAVEADALPSGTVLNVGTGVQTANEELVALAERVTGRRIATAAGAHPGRHWDTGDWVSDPSAARAALGWEPAVDLAEGLRRCWEAGA